MTFFRLPNGYSANISEFYVDLTDGNDCNYQLTVKNVCGNVEETTFVATIAEAMELLAEY